MVSSDHFAPAVIQLRLQLRPTVLFSLDEARSHVIHYALRLCASVSIKSRYIYVSYTVLVSISTPSKLQRPANRMAKSACIF